MHRVRALAATALLALAACSGGTHPAAVVPASTGTAPPGTGNVTFTLTIPNKIVTASAHRAPAFISPSVLSGTITVAGATTELDLGIGGPLCTAGTVGRTCSISLPAPVGNDTFTVVLYDGAFDTMYHVHTGVAIGSASRSNVTIAEGQANVAVPLVVGGVPAYVGISAGPLIGGQATTVPLIVNVYDYDHNLIVGPGAYVNALGSPASVTIALRTSTGQMTLNNTTPGNVQSGSSITVAAPSDTLTVQLNAPATILGAMVKTTNYTNTVLPAYNSTDYIAVSGPLNATLLASSLTFFPDYLYFAPSDSTLVTGVPNGFAISIESTGSGIIGFFNSATETFTHCGFSGYNIAVAPAPSGIAVAYNGTDNVSQAPNGVNYYPTGSLTGGGCAGGTSYQTSPTSPWARALVYDPSNGVLFEGDSNGSSGAYSYDTFSSPNFSGNTVITSSLQSYPHDMLAMGGKKYFLIASGSTIYQSSGLFAASSTTSSSATLTSLAAGPDGTVYGLDTTAHEIWTFVNTGAALASYTPAGAFSSVSSQTNNLAIGPDGNAYITDGASLVESISPTGVYSSYSIPAPGGNLGYLRAIFDGQNGFVYGYYDDGLHAGTEYVFRISH